MKLTNEQIEFLILELDDDRLFEITGAVIKERLGEFLSLRKENEDLKSRLARNYDEYKKIEEVKQGYNPENKLLRKELEQTKKELEQVINEESDGVNVVV